MKGNFHRKLFRMDEFGRRYYCQHARLNQLRADKKAAKKAARRYIEYQKAEIRINRNMPDVMKVQTLIHEWVHGAFVMIGRNDLTDDENLVQCLAVAINNTFTIREDKKA